MIYLIVGEDVYKRREAMDGIIKSVAVQPEKFDGLEMTENQLADAVAGATLFSSERLVVIYELSANKVLWQKLADWLERVSSDTTLILIEPRPDKRTKPYKTIAKVATVKTAEPWTGRDINVAERWVIEQGSKLGVKLTREQAATMVQRAILPAERPGAFTIDQQVLANALEALSVLTEVDAESIAAVLPESSADNVFELLQTALSGDKERTLKLVHNLQATADPYMTLGLLMSQWSQLVALKVAGVTPDELAEVAPVSPYALKKLQHHAHRLTTPRLKELTELLAKVDVQSKTTSADPWTLIEAALIEIAS